MARLSRTHSEDAAGNVRRLEKLADEILSHIGTLEDCEETGDLGDIGRSLLSVAQSLEYLGLDFTRWAEYDEDNEDEVCQDCGGGDLCPVCDECRGDCDACTCEEEEEED